MIDAMDPEYCYVEFFAADEEALERLNSLLELLKRDPSAGRTPEKALLAFLRERDLGTFWWPNESQYAEVRTRWATFRFEYLTKPKMNKKIGMCILCSR